MKRIRILIVEDHQMFRAGIVALLNKCHEFEIVGEAENGVRAIELAKELKPDIVLMDIQLPIMNGVKASQKILKDSTDIKILALTLCAEEQNIVEMVKAGARGYILKEGTIDELKTAIKALMEGSSYFSKDVSPKLFARLNRKETNQKLDIPKDLRRYITIREFEILEFVAAEFSNQEIADKLFISPRTVETHKRNLIQKLKVKNTIGLVKYYLKIPQNKISTA